MAKKSAKKPAPKKPAAKPAAKPPAKKASGGGSPGKIPGSPKRVTTGPGKSPEQIGKQLVNDFNRGKWEINMDLWSPKLVSIEGGGLAWHGIKNVEIKNAGWMAQNAIRGAVAEGPFVGSTGFSVKYRMDIEDRKTLKRTIMEEVGVYTVKNGKIVQEEFMYGSMQSADSAAPTA
ncbi:MAG: hypothetical protein K2W85_13240 [Phycisphaerales bacterium]|nr:hypothetical protein [Phycisphaerales bacterium]